jgi:transcriptional regulator with XRE-family HTH domain
MRATGRRADAANPAHSPVLVPPSLNTIVIASMASKTSHHRPLEFDARRFAEWLWRSRTQREWSTRELSQRAGISQPYVVALERARLSSEHPAPTPTVNVVASIAAALDTDPIALIRRTLRPAPRHVLLVVDGAHQPPIDVIRNETGSTADAWICGRGQAPPKHSKPCTHDIRLHRESMKEYDPDKISALLDRELNRIVGDIEGKNLGLVFGETSSVMSYVSNPDSLIEFETRWKELVSNSVSSVGAHAAWNICVYEADILRSRKDVETTMDFLFEHHDEHWFAKGSRVHMGEVAKTKILRAVA